MYFTIVENDLRSGVAVGICIKVGILTGSSILLDEGVIQSDCEEAGDLHLRNVLEATTPAVV